MLPSESRQKQQHAEAISQAKETDSTYSSEPTIEELLDIAAQLQSKPSKPPTPCLKSKAPLSIDDIIGKHVSANPAVFGLKRSAVAKTVAKSFPDKRASTSTVIPSGKGRSSILATLSAETPSTISKEHQGERGDRSHPAPVSAHHSPEGIAETAGEARKKRSSTLGTLFSRTNSSPFPSIPSSIHASAGATFASRRLPILSRSTPARQSEERRESVATYLKSPRLTRMITLRRGAGIGQQISVADVGSAEGYPVVIFLGLGCVRYLVALFDEIAIAHNIRLICIDRSGTWPVDKHSTVP